MNQDTPEDNNQEQQDNSAPPADQPLPPFEEWVVGYRKAPVEHRFKKGASGNPRGRPRKRELGWSKRQLSNLIIEEAFREVEVVVNGKKKRTAVVALAVRQMFAASARGNRFIFRELLAALAEALAHRERLEPTLHRVVEDREHNAIMKGHDPSNENILADLNYWRKRSQQT